MADVEKTGFRSNMEMGLDVGLGWVGDWKQIVGIIDKLTAELSVEAIERGLERHCDCSCGFSCGSYD